MIICPILRESSRPKTKWSTWSATLKNPILWTLQILPSEQGPTSNQNSWVINGFQVYLYDFYIYIYYTHNLTRIQPNKKLIQQNSKPLIYETKRPHDPGSKDKTLIPFVKMGVEAREQTVPWGRESFLSRFYFE